jgi:hypothetical protein
MFAQMNRATFTGWFPRRLAYSFHWQGSMIEVDDSKLTDCHRDYLERWAAILGVPVAELLGRILLVGIEGEVYCEKAPPE